MWGGRYGPQVRGVLDGWNCGRSQLASVLKVAGELVVLDALSFPWELLNPENLDIPLVVALPASLNASEIDAALGGPLLCVLTPFDRLIESRPDVRSALQQRWGLSDEAWISIPDSSIEGVLAALSERSESRIVDVVPEFGTFRDQRDDVVTRHLRHDGAHRRATLNVLLAVIRDDDVVVDVGADIGTLAIPLATRLADRGHVFAVEGNPSAARLLRVNVAANRMEQRITVLERVVGSTAGERLRRRDVGGNTGAMSMIEAGSSHPVAFDRTSLDALAEENPDLDRVTLLKLDTEATELAVLEGAAGLIARTRPLIVCQVSLDRLGASVHELDRWLAEAEYKLELIAGGRHGTERIWQLKPFGRLSDRTDLYFDVLAVPVESNRVADLRREGVV